MANETLRNIRLGLFVTIGTALLIAALYLIGNKQNIFGSTFRISAKFYNVNGLMSGDRKSTRLNSSHIQKSRMPSSA